LTAEKEAALRARIGKMLADGLKTQTEPFPETDREFGRLLTELRGLQADDLKGKLVLSGLYQVPLIATCPILVSAQQRSTSSIKVDACTGSD